MCAIGVVHVNLKNRSTGIGFKVYIVMSAHVQLSQGCTIFSRMCIYISVHIQGRGVEDVLCQMCTSPVQGVHQRVYSMYSVYLSRR